MEVRANQHQRSDGALDADHRLEPEDDPDVEESEYVGQKSSSFLNRYYDGHISSMVSAYLENDRLSEGELDELRALLKNKVDN